MRNTPLFLIVFGWASIFPSNNLSSSGTSFIPPEQEQVSLIDSLDDAGRQLDMKLEQLESTAKKSSLDEPEPPKVVYKTKVRTIEKDSAAVWVRHPDGSLERIVYCTKNTPIIETVNDTVYLKREWFLKRWINNLKNRD